MAGPSPESVDPTDPKFQPVIVAFNVRVGGRPSSYTNEIAELICERLANGESLLRICNEDGMPSRMTVYNWLLNKQDFFDKYVRAREIQADHMDDLVNETARVCTPFNAQAVRVQIDAYKWRAAKLKPKSYGDKIQHADAEGEKLPSTFFQIIAGK